MRRKVLEWSLWLAVTAFVGVVSLGVASFIVPRAESFLAVGDRFYALLRPGWIDLASGLDNNPGQPGPLTLHPRNIIAPKVSRSGSIALPGFTLTFCLFKGGGAIWSTRISLLVPLLISLFMIAIVFHRLKRRQGRASKPQCAAK